MTLQEAEQDERFNGFKFCSMIELAQYIVKCSIYLGQKEDAEVREFYTAACLIRDKRIGATS